jgi:hypothetical protein
VKYHMVRKAGDRFKGKKVKCASVFGGEVQWRSHTERGTFDRSISMDELVRHMRLGVPSGNCKSLLGSGVFLPNNKLNFLTIRQIHH